MSAHASFFSRFRSVFVVVSAACVAVSAVVVMMVPSAGAVSAAPAERAMDQESHCVWFTEPAGRSGALGVVDEVCFEDLADALTAAGADESMYETVGAQRSKAAASSASRSGSTVLGIHFDGTNYSGSSFAVVGSDCGGGYVNMSTAWDDRVSSTANGCPQVDHFTNPNLVGVSESTTGSGGNLLILSNLVSSIRYTT